MYVVGFKIKIAVFTKKNPNIFILLLKLQYKDTTHCTCTQKRDSQRWSTKPCLNKLCVWDNVQMFYVLYIKDNNFMIDCMCIYKRNDMIKQVKNMVDRCRFIYTNWSSFSICILWPKNQTRRHQSKEKVFFRSTPAFFYFWLQQPEAYKPSTKRTLFNCNRDPTKQVSYNYDLSQHLTFCSLFWVCMDFSPLNFFENFFLSINQSIILDDC